MIRPNENKNVQHQDNLFYSNEILFLQRKPRERLFYYTADITYLFKLNDAETTGLQHSSEAGNNSS